MQKSFSVNDVAVLCNVSPNAIRTLHRYGDLRSDRPANEEPEFEREQIKRFLRKRGMEEAFQKLELEDNLAKALYERA